MEVVGTCPQCGRNVKNVNMERHKVVCARVPVRALPSEDDISEPEVKAATSTGNAEAMSSESSNSTDRVEPAGADAPLFRRWFREANFPPELPTLHLSREEMETWLYAFEEQLSMLGISDDATKYQLLLSSLSQEVMAEMGDVVALLAALPEQPAYHTLLEALFHRHKI